MNSRTTKFFVSVGIFSMISSFIPGVTVYAAPLPDSLWFPNSPRTFNEKVTALAEQDIPNLRSYMPHLHAGVDATTLTKMCNVMGYGRATNTRVHHLVSCHNDTVLFYNSSNDSWYVENGCTAKDINKTLKCVDPLPQCRNNNDDDGDGLLDMNDPGCSNPNDDDESTPPECSDGIDNDGDIVMDSADPGCYNAQGIFDPSDDDESDGTTQCQNGQDDDGDFAIDCNDPGCHTDGNASNNTCDPTRNESNPQQCGNGLLESGEQCDDGKLVNGDGCDSGCNFEFCGNGIVQLGEQCDDGNQNNIDSCSNSCVSASCGDGQIQTGVETCDDGALNGQPNKCNLTCSGITSSSCGNKVLEPGESCDDGNTSNNDFCLNSCENAICGDDFVNSGIETCDSGLQNGQPNNCNSTCSGVTPSTCGNGMVEIGELCDDGANNGKPNWCSLTCSGMTASSCGNSVVEIGEQCDDGNTNNNDACLNTCASATCGDGHIEAGIEACDDGANNGQPNFCNTQCSGTTVSVCGNNVLEGGEECDDGNTNNTDTCLNSCDSAICGDGFVHVGVEGCDDGALTGQPNQCNLTCDGTTASVCGNNIVEIGETCDDGISNGQPNQCNLTCNGTTGSVCGNGTVETGEQCDTAGESATCDIDCSTASCGDGLTNTTSGETCDDGANNGQSNFCNSTCNGSTAGVCRNGVLESGEQCDDGNVSNTDACLNSCISATCGDGHTNVGTELCDKGPLNGQPKQCNLTCDGITPSICGNNVVEIGELCDDGVLNGSPNWCSLTCSGMTASSCGNSVVEIGEQCDDGNTSNADTCLNSCEDSSCGDGHVEAGIEVCDDGANNGQPNFCNAQCSGTSAPVCGNSVTEAGEQCDDGNTINTDTCLSSCVSATCGDGQIQTGVETCDDGALNGQPNKCNLICSGPTGSTCGNGIVEIGELCDDGANNGQPNHCSNSCSGMTSSVCGNSVTEIGEQCDDGNTSNADTCLNSCVSATCGDGQTQTGVETCDDGANNGQPNHCNSQCSGQTSSVCGNNVLEAGEQCDDGNANNTDACLISCVIATCGDNFVQVGVEGCDDGANNGQPNMCNLTCDGTTASVCGNNIVEIGETCDDGISNGQPNMCNLTCNGATGSVCGNGTVEAGEQCDTAGESATCDIDCSFSSCGDGSINTTAGETCDDGANNGQPNQCNLTCNGTTAPICGNATTETGEQCDDGNTDVTDSCLNSCVSATCGDGFVQIGIEHCDNGPQNGQPNHCNATCSGVTVSSCGNGIVEIGELCDDGLNNGQPNWCNNSCDGMTGSVCGNTVVEIGEECDGGGETATCNADCTNASCGDSTVNATAGEECDDGNGSNLDACLNSCISATCGDGHTNIGTELCDDGVLNGQPNQCNSTCDGATPIVCGNGVIEPGESCDDGSLNGDPNQCNLTCDGTTGSVCGNSVVEAGEDCDDGNTNNTDSCLNSCEDAICGDGHIQTGVEICDDGSLNGDPNQCNATCNGITFPVCGNSATEAGEECDDGSETASCDADCSLTVCGDGAINSTAGETCDDGVLNGNPNQCNLTCDGTTGSVCGNGTVEAGEQCDDAGESPTCDIDCSTATCGDGMINATSGETCDDGANNGQPNFCNSQCSGTTVPVCGNATAEAGEQCDDGNTDVTDSCLNSCEDATCGDGFVHDGVEHCDNGPLNGQPNHCNATCTGVTPSVCGNNVIEIGESCDDGVLNGDPNQCNLTCDGQTGAVCGNSVVEAGEECDDGNSSNADSCLNSCEDSECGDGHIETGVETCDDGPLNGQPNQCNSQCSGQTVAVCGNSLVETGEDCDDGNVSNLDACLNSCEDASCGDGNIHIGVELCDDGVLNGDPNQCNLTCDGPTPPVCGNDVIEPGETCDDGASNGQPNQCNLTCDGQTGAVCGNGTVEAGEQCDDSGESPTCDIDCSLTSCGDGLINATAGETCDDGVLNGNPNQCNLTCNGTTVGVCGNAIPEAGEQCDDGNTVDTDACLDTCEDATCGDGFVHDGVEHCDNGPLNGQPNHCNDTCSGVTPSVCGNGTVEIGELCDDGVLNGQPNWCSSSCDGMTPSVCGNTITEIGEQCDDGGETATCDADCSNASCGDSTVNITAGEECDDGNGDNNDACLNSCENAVCGDGHVEAGVETCDDGVLNGQPNHCNLTCDSITIASCGNGVQESGEECDDGIETAQCDSDCSLAICGDGFTNNTAGEDCDDGNTDNNDACLNTCEDAVCGDDYIHIGVETCDDGALNGDPNQCNLTCDGTTPADCGNGVIESGETCDDGLLNGDPNQCNLTCDGTTVSSCGNGVQEAGEECDGGGETASCDSDCSLASCGDGLINNSAGETCDDGASNGQPNMCNLTCNGETPAVCGNSVTEAGEDCDDGNTDNNDACISCAIASCGDDFIQIGVETCDDGALNGTPNQCNLTCDGTTAPFCGNDVIEAGETCDDGALNGQPNQCNLTCDGDTAPFCGNSVQEAGEECDDGNTDNNDACLNSCEDAECGDGHIETGVETCDDGLLNGDPNQCNLTCDGDTAPVCGNSVTESGEDCDDGDLDNLDECLNSCESASCGDAFVHMGVEACDDGIFNGQPNKCNLVCDGTTTPVCGNDIIEAGETCDDGALNGQPNQCNTTCDSITIASCGNSVQEAGEECDEGGETASCDSDCTLTVCGDGVINNSAGETCDDGNLDNMDACLNSCENASCGDGFTNIGVETCDDGLLNGDPNRCNLTCDGTTASDCGNGVIESGETCDDGANNGQPNFCNATCNGDTTAVCGNSVTEAGEDCDDGNVDNTDACIDCVSSVCGDGFIEAGVETCDDGLLNGDPNQCNLTCDGDTAPVCGNSVTETGEDCDDGNQIQTDACLNGCINAECGDSIIHAGVETCDDGVLNGDPNQCNLTCDGDTPADCGNGVIESGETCDDGADNGQPNFCNATCDGQTGAVCGNGIQELGEECDGGGETALCDSDCTASSCGDSVINNSAGETCDDGANNGQPNMCNLTCNGETPAVCGNSVVEAGEDCDDGNQDNMDSCLNTCEDASCGDGFTNIGVETCDDGLLNGDPNRCNLTCDGTTASDCGNGVIESGETCDDGLLNGEPNQCNLACDGQTGAVCGNSVTETGEDCDDGNADNTDACIDCVSSVCGDGHIEAGVETCDDGALNGDPNQCNLTCDGQTVSDCGNGVQEAGEECDDGVDNSNITPDACRTDCTNPICGDSVTDAGETCDDGLLNGEPNHCNLLCNGITTSSCGNGIIEASEICDDGVLNGEPNQCNATCDGQTPAVCGNYIIETGETCDDGTENGKPDMCNRTCDGQTDSVCGNNILEVGEECDDGNLVNGDGCSDVCQDEVIQTVDLAIEKTGPATVQSGGTITYMLTITNSGTGTATIVTAKDPVPVGLEFSPSLSHPECVLNGSGTDVLCNNTTLPPGSGKTFDLVFEFDEIEVCDTTVLNTATVTGLENDGDLSDNTSATIETFVDCSAITAACSDAEDNDSDTLFDCSDPGCHTDGDALNTSSCDPNDDDESHTPGCGDGVTDPGETCDDGGSNGQPNMCNLTCDGTTDSVCGNGTVESGEQCDDGGLVNGDGCDDTCQIEAGGVDLSIAKELNSGLNDVRPGGIVKYTLTVVNNGTETGTNITAVDAIPAGLSFNVLESDVDCVQEANDILCDNLDLLGGEQKTYIVAFDIPDNDTICDLPIMNTATVAGLQNDPDTTNNESEVSVTCQGNGDAPICNGVPATIYVNQNGIIVGGPDDGDTYTGKLDGTSGDDVVAGTDGRDDIDGGNGDDTICGYGGDDDIQGDTGNDIILGGEGNDEIQGDSGNDVIHGDSGNDEIQGDNGNDTICGGSGIDDISSNNGDDLIAGGEGNDLIDGGSQDDKIDGGDGTDNINGGFGSDTCSTGDNNSNCEVEEAVTIAACEPGGAQVVVDKTQYEYTCSDGAIHLDTTSTSRTDLYLVSEVTGVSTHVMELDGTQLMTLAADTNGSLYALEETIDHKTGDLVLVNSDGTVTSVGSTGINGVVSALGFSFDGTLYALEQETGTLYIIDTTTGSATALHTFASIDVRGGDLVVNSDNDVVYVRNSGEVYVIDLDEANPVPAQTGILPQDGRSYSSLVQIDGTYYALDEVTDEAYSFTDDVSSAILVSRNSGPFGPGDGASCPAEEVTTVGIFDIGTSSEEPEPVGRHHRKKKLTPKAFTLEQIVPPELLGAGGDVPLIPEDVEQLVEDIRDRCFMTKFRPDGRPYKCRRMNGG